MDHLTYVIKSNILHQFRGKEFTLRVTKKERVAVEIVCTFSLLK